MRPSRPWVIGHRGASGLRPEHTIAAYKLAIEQGADFVEPDLVPTKDGVLIARHENEISETTDVADRPEFAERNTVKAIEGRRVSGWFAEDFTLAELKTLRARERMPHVRPASAAFDGEFGLTTLEEIVALVAERSAALGREVGIVAEIKHAPYFQEVGLPFEDLLLPTIERHGFRRESPFFVEAFDPGILERLRRRTDVRLVQLLDGEVSRERLAEIARHADAIGPEKGLIVPRDAEGRSLPPTSLVEDAHAAGLLVFAWTFRSENLFLPAELREGEDLLGRGNAAAEYRRFYGLGVDAVFSDFPADAVAAREA
jgi:glycerophosphoryl diester phosphodiesterase